MNISDRIICDKIIKDSKISSNSEKNNHSDQIDTESQEITSAENAVQSSVQEQSLSNITNEMQQNVDNTQSSEVLPQTGVKDSSNIPIGYTIISSSILLLAVSSKIIGNSLKKLV